MNRRMEPIIHYDLKPANIIYFRGQVKVTDFGLSKIIRKSGEPSPTSIAPSSTDFADIIGNLDRLHVREKSIEAKIMSKLREPDQIQISIDPKQQQQQQQMSMNQNLSLVNQTQQQQGPTRKFNCQQQQISTTSEISDNQTSNDRLSSLKNARFQKQNLKDNDSWDSDDQNLNEYEDAGMNTDDNDDEEEDDDDEQSQDSEIQKKVQGQGEVSGICMRKKTTLNAMKRMIGIPTKKTNNKISKSRSKFSDNNNSSRDNIVTTVKSESDRQLTTNAQQQNLNPKMTSKMSMKQKFKKRNRKLEPLVKDLRLNPSIREVTQEETRGFAQLIQRKRLQDEQIEREITIETLRKAQQQLSKIMQQEQSKRGPSCQKNLNPNMDHTSLESDDVLNHNDINQILNHNLNLAQQQSSDINYNNVKIQKIKSAAEIRAERIVSARQKVNSKFEDLVECDLTSPGCGTYWYLPLECFPKKCDIEVEQKRKSEQQQLQQGPNTNNIDNLKKKSLNFNIAAGREQYQQLQQYQVTRDSERSQLKFQKNSQSQQCTSPELVIPEELRSLNNNDNNAVTSPLESQCWQDCSTSSNFNNCGAEPEMQSDFNQFFEYMIEHLKPENEHKAQQQKIQAWDQALKNAKVYWQVETSFENRKNYLKLLWDQIQQNKNVNGQYDQSVSRYKNDNYINGPTEPVFQSPQIQNIKNQSNDHDDRNQKRQDNLIEDGKQQLLFINDKNLKASGSCEIQMPSQIQSKSKQAQAGDDDHRRNRRVSSELFKDSKEKEHIKEHAEQQFQEGPMPIKRQPTFVSNKVDVWSVGVILYEMLYGRRPFGSNLSQSKFYWACINGTVSLEVKFPETPKVSNEVKDFLRRILEPDHEKRPSIFDVCNDPYLTKGR